VGGEISGKKTDQTKAEGNGELIISGHRGKGVLGVRRSPARMSIRTKQRKPQMAKTKQE